MNWSRFTDAFRSTVTGFLATPEGAAIEAAAAAELKILEAEAEVKLKEEVGEFVAHAIAVAEKDLSAPAK